MPYSRGKISIFLLFVLLLATKFCLQVEGYYITLSPLLCAFVLIRFALFHLWNCTKD
jgi:hypothetical protein